MSDLTVSMPPALQSWVDTRLAEGAYADAGDYLRDLVRQDRRAFEEDRQWLTATIQEGLDSPVLDRDPRDLITEMIDEGLASDVCDKDAFEVLDDIIAEDPDLRV